MSFSGYVIAICILTLWISLSPARAGCDLADTPGPQDYRIVRTWDIRHIADKHPTGCLAMLEGASGEILAYTPYRFLCKTPAAQSLNLDLVPGCCDSGREGDYPCGVMPKNGKDEHLQTHLTAVPAIPDSRVIPELVAKLAGMAKNREILGIGAVSTTLAEYAANPEFTADVEKHAEKLKASFKASGDPWARKAIARVLIAISEKGRQPPDIDHVASMLQDTIYRLDPEQIDLLRGLQKTPRNPGKILPVLMETLENVYEDDDILVVMQVIGAYREGAAPHLQDIYTRLENLPHERNERRRPPEILMAQWKSMVCSSQPVHTTPAVHCTNR